MQIGYWSIPITSADTNYSTSVSPYIPGAWPYLLRALGWAKEHDIHVILDLHGAPGSQNGYDNSGRRGSADWAQGDNVARTLDLVRFMAAKIGGMIDVLELLNEPGGFQSDIANVIPQFWKDGYNAVREAAGPSLKVMIGDAFLGVGVGSQAGDGQESGSDGWIIELGRIPDVPGSAGGSHGFRKCGDISSRPLSWVVLTPAGCAARIPDIQLRPDRDVPRPAHQRTSSVVSVQTFVGLAKLDDRIGGAALQYSCQVLDTLSSYAKSNLYTVSGEWSNAVTDCAKWLNGRGVGARWDGTWQPDQPTFGSCDSYTGNMSTFSDDYKTFLRKCVSLHISD